MLTMTCSRGCDLRDEDTSEITTYECAAKGCDNDNLCEGCTYVCAGDCGDDLCFDHVIDVNPNTEAEALYLCHGCVAKVAALAFEKIAVAA